MLIVSLKIRKDKAHYSEITGMDILKNVSTGIVIGGFLFDSTIAFAGNTVSSAFKPIINTLQDLAEPVSYGFMIKGFLQIVAGESEKGKKTIKNSIAGYIGIQWLPWIFSLIRGIGAQN